MRWSDIPFRPPTSTLRWFAVLCVLLFAGMAIAEGRARGITVLTLACAGMALGFVAVGIVAPARLRPVYVGLMVVTFPLNWAFSHVLLALFFYCLFTPLGLFFRLIGRDALALRVEPDRASYWTARPAAEDVRSYFRQS